jgi:D-alanyl-D-alanine carboxypeptidase/D-alanyl-D-alanine-endopeptidase (penicillin-binding protein 4)
MKQFGRFHIVPHFTFLFGKKLFFRGLKQSFSYFCKEIRNNMNIFKRFATVNYGSPIFFFLLLFAGQTYMLPAQTHPAINTFVQHPNLKYAGIGINVVDISTGKALCCHNADLSLCPASTLKMLTTATALEIFGSEYTFSTDISYTGAINAQGTLNGDLLIIGSGDPTLGSSSFNRNSDSPETFLPQWLAAVKQSGIKTIAGSIIVVDDLYGYEGVSNRWMWGDLGNYYAAPTYGISIFDNTYKIYFKTGAPQTTPEILYTTPEIPELFFENHLKAAANSQDSAYICGIPFSCERRLYGTVPVNKTSFFIKGNIPDPGMLLAQTFSACLKRNGIHISGDPATTRLKNPLQKEEIHPLYTHSGNTLQEIIRVTNFHSNNHFAEHLFHKIGWDKTQACTTHVPTLAAQKINRFWQQRGIDMQGLFQYDGSGLSNANAITASTLTSLLVYMQKQSKYADVFYQSLPLAGKEGTIKSFLRETKLEGKARIKSGSISNVQAYAGYIEKTGKRYAFAIIVNNFTGNRSELKAQMAALLLGL